MSALSSAAWVTAPDDDAADRAMTLGRPLRKPRSRSSTSVSGATVGPEVIGELCTRGYDVMSGYLDDAVATADAVDDDGWLHTGDLASMDSRGYFRIGGRLKDMIIRGGENIYPREIEPVLFEHEDVADVAVLDARWGEQVAAFIRPACRAPDSGELVAYCRERLAPYKIPGHWTMLARSP